MLNRNDTGWNRHNGVGATLLENWVEERAVGAQVLYERENIKKISTTGHEGILNHKTASSKVDEKEFISTSHDSYSVKKTNNKSGNELGKRRRIIELELYKKAVEEMKEAPEDKSAKDWISTSRIAFDHSDIYPEILDLGTQPPSEEEIEKYKTPVTIYSDQKPSLTNLTVICSTPFQELKTTQKEIMRFGKHSEFSTPIKLIK